MVTTFASDFLRNSHFCRNTLLEYPGWRFKSKRVAKHLETRQSSTWVEPILFWLGVLRIYSESRLSSSSFSCSGLFISSRLTSFYLGPWVFSFPILVLLAAIWAFWFCISLRACWSSLEHQLRLFAWVSGSIGSFGPIYIVGFGSTSSCGPRSLSCTSE